MFVNPTTNNYIASSSTNFSWKNPHLFVALEFLQHWSCEVRNEEAQQALNTLIKLMKSSILWGLTFFFFNILIREPVNISEYDVFICRNASCKIWYQRDGDSIDGENV